MKVIINKDTETPGNIDIMLTECTPEEAAALLYIADNVGGHPDGVRGAFSHGAGDLRGVLQDAGVDVETVRKKYDLPDIRSQGGIYFNPKGT